MTDPTYSFAFIIGALITTLTLLWWHQSRREKIIKAAPTCTDCKHCTYLSDRTDRYEWGIEWPSDSGYYCKLSEYKISSGGVEVTGFDKKRLNKCETERRRSRCGPAAKLFEDGGKGND